MRIFRHIQNENAFQTLIQPQLEIGKEDDEHEKEANHVADKVMRVAEPGKETMTESKPKLQKMTERPSVMKMAESIAKPKMQESGVKIQKQTMNASAGIAAPQQVEQGINSSKGSGQSLSADLQQEMGSKMNADFSDVKIHSDQHAAAMNKEVGAKAFTHGNDIYFNSNQYNPSSTEGKHLLAHELTHTAQQGNGINRKIQRAKWNDQTTIEKNPAELFFKYSQAPGQTTLTFNGNTPSDLSPTNLLVSLLPAATNIIMSAISQSDYKAAINPAYEINSSANMTIAGAPNYSGAIPKTSETNGWSWQINPAKYSFLSGNPDLAGITSVNAISFDPAGSDAFVERVKLGELHHVTELKRLHEKYVTKIEKRLLQLEGRGSNGQEAFNALNNAIFQDEIITRNIDAYINDYDASDVHQYDQTSYLLHQSNLNYVGISSDKKKIGLSYVHKYTMGLMKDPSDETITAPGKAGEKIKYKKAIAPVLTPFDPAQIFRSGKNILYSSGGKVLKAFKTEADAILAFNAIKKFGFNTIEQIGKYENFSVSGTHASGLDANVNNKTILPDYFSVGYENGWNLSEALKRNPATPDVRNTQKYYKFPDSLDGMNSAFSAFDIISNEKMYNFHWIGGTTEKPEMSFWTT